MAYNKFKFDPEDGFADSSFYEDTPENPREILQRQHNQTRDYINSVINTLNSSNKGSSGSESIMSPEIEGVSGNNVFEQIKDIKRQINDTAEAIIPDASVGEEKIKIDAITNSKIKDGAISTNKLSDDLTAPYANDVLNINGQKASVYTPLFETGFSGGMKRLLTTEKITSVRGKTLNGKRYFIKDDYLYSMDLTDGTFEKIMDTRLRLYNSFAVPDEETVYYVIVGDAGDNKANFILYKYDRKYQETEKIAEIQPAYATLDNIIDINIETDGENFYLGLKLRFQYSSYYNYCYKISFSELTAIVVPNTYFSYESSYKNLDMFLEKGNLYFGSRVFINADLSDVKIFPADILSCDSYGNILTDDEYFPFYSLETQLPEYANLTPLVLNGFVYENYLYVLINGYVFKTKLNKEEII